MTYAFDDDGKLVACEFVQDNMGPPLKDPSILVIHYTVSARRPGTVRALEDESQKASVHFVMGKDGVVTQMVPCSRVAWHAGKSIWRGRPSCSLYSIGIEVVNVGPVKKKGDGYVDVYNQPYEGGVFEGRHKNPNVKYSHWAKYPGEQMQALVELGRAIVEHYPTIKEIVGHDDISPGRKTDPGPAFDMALYTDMVLGTEAYREEHDGP